MTRSRSNRRWSRVALAAVLGAVVVVGCAGLSARAADDDDDDALPDTKFFRGVLHALGLRRDGEGIDYRERSPLVLPPNGAINLPPPETDNPAKKDAAWPVDPDVKRAKALKAARKVPNKNPEDERPLLPNEYNLPAPASASSRPNSTNTGSMEGAAKPSSPYELGAKSIFSGSFWGSKTQETKTFTGEPPRADLTEPPPGYRTPSPNQPYGVGIEPAKPTAVEDRSIPVR
jgi:hypothetical protein